MLRRRATQNESAKIKLFLQELHLYLVWSVAVGSHIVDTEKDEQIFLLLRDLEVKHVQTYPFYWF